MDAKEVEFVTMSEYSEDKDISRARNRFFGGHSPILLFTERFHFFRRLRIRGMKQLIFFSPPETAHFYSELVNMLEDVKKDDEMLTCMTFFTPYDVPALERIVGTHKVSDMVNPSAKSNFVFV